MLAAKPTLSRAVKPSFTPKKDGLIVCDEKRPGKGEKEESANLRTGSTTGPTSLVRTGNALPNKSIIVPHGLPNTSVFTYGLEMGAMMVWNVEDDSIAASSKNSSTITTASSGMFMVRFNAPRGRLFTKGHVYVPSTSLLSIATIDTSDSRLHYVFADDEAEDKENDKDKQLAVVASKPKLPRKGAFPDPMDASVEKDTLSEGMLFRMNALLRRVPVTIITTITTADDETPDEVSPLSIQDFNFYGGAFFESDNEDEYYSPLSIHDIKDRAFFKSNKDEYSPPSIDNFNFNGGAFFDSGDGWCSEEEEEEESLEDPLIVLARELGMEI